MKAAPDQVHLDALEKLLADAARCSDEHPEGAPGSTVAALEARFEALKMAWLRWLQSGGNPSLDYLRVRRMDWHVEEPFRTDTESRLSFERTIAVERWYKIELGKPPRQPPELRSAVGEAQRWLNQLEEELRYAAARRGSTTRCDCNAASAIGKAPKTELEDLGDTSDGYYQGSSYRCRECGARWTCLLMDDSVGSGRWSRG